MPKYNTYQYSIKQYGRFESKKPDHSKHNYIFLKSRMLSNINNEKVWIYSTGPTTIKKKVQKLRLKSNTGEILYNKQLLINKEIDKIRIKSNLNKEEFIYSMRGWG